MDTETLKPVAFLAAIVIGQILLVYVPYYLKQREDGRPFDELYAYTAAIGYLMMAVGALSSDVIMDMPFEFMSIMYLMFGGALAQGAVFGRITPKRIIVVDA